MIGNMKQTHKEKARELFLKGYNCSQAVFCAFAKEYGIDEQLALKLSASFGGGIGRMRETCGAMCGAAMLTGLETGQTDCNDIEGKQRNYHAVQELARLFREKNGSIKCSELLKLRHDAAISDQPDKRTAEYYRQRPCLKMVDTAVEIFEEMSSAERINR